MLHAIVFIGICIIFLVILFLLFNSVGFFFGAPFAATSASTIEKLFKLVHVDSKDIVYDLGSGDGRLLLAAAEREAHSEGWEFNLPLYLLSLIRVKKSKNSPLIQIHPGNFWNADLSKATVIFAFLLPQYMNRLEKKLRQEGKPGTKVITYLARLPGIQSVKEVSNGLAIYQL